MSGLITLALLAGLCAFIANRVMKRLGMKPSRNTNIGIVFVFVVVVLMLWGQDLSK